MYLFMDAFNVYIEVQYDFEMTCIILMCRFGIMLILVAHLS